MPTTNDGSFSFTIPAADLARGLRPSSESPRNVKYLTICEGAVGYNNVLKVLDDLGPQVIDTSALTEDFPFPQIFVFTNVIIVCGEQDIYELVAGSLVHRLSVAAGITWSAIDFFDYIYMTNGKVAVIRSATDKVWQTTSALPFAGAACNLNGQVMLGAPEVDQS